MSSSSSIGRPSPRADIAARAFACVFPFAAAWLYLVVLAGHESGVVQAAYGAAKVLQFALPAVWIGLVCRQSLRLPLARIEGVRSGLLLGLTVVAGMLLTYYLWLKPEQYLAHFAPMIRAKARGFGMGSQPAFIAGAVLLSSLHAFLEEYYWRWFVFGGLLALHAGRVGGGNFRLGLLRAPCNPAGDLLWRADVAGRILLALCCRRRRGLGRDLSSRRLAAGPVAQPRDNRCGDFCRGI